MVVGYSVAIAIKLLSLLVGYKEAMIDGCDRFKKGATISA